MSESEPVYPSEKNLGKKCLYWRIGSTAASCWYPKDELQGRTTCGGIIDDVCLYVKDGRTPSDISRLLLAGIKTEIPNGGALLPPGQIE